MNSTSSGCGQMEACNGQTLTAYPDLTFGRSSNDAECSLDTDTAFDQYLRSTSASPSLSNNVESEDWSRVVLDQADADEFVNSNY